MCFRPAVGEVFEGMWGTKTEKAGQFRPAFSMAGMMRLHHQGQTLQFLTQGFHIEARAFDAAGGIQS